MDQQTPLQSADKCATIEPHPTDMVLVSREWLENLERRLIPALVEQEQALVVVQQALGKAPDVSGRGVKGLTRAERRRR